MIEIMKYFCYLYCVFALFGNSFALNFQANCDIYKNNAVIKSDFYYSDELQTIRHNYYDPITMSELTDYKNNIKYKYCDQCEAGYINLDFPFYIL